MMTRPTRHRAARTPSKHPDAGLPEPGQALIGFPAPQRSLFGVPQPAARPTPRPATPPRPRAAQDDYPDISAHPARPRRRGPQQPRRSTRSGRRTSPRRWLQLLAVPLAIVTLGVALGVITVVMLIAAGVP